MEASLQPFSIYISQVGVPDLHVRASGKDEPLCLLIHGFGEGAFVWNEFAPLVAPYCRTLAVDLRGHGDSDWDPDGHYDIHTHVADLSRVIVSFGIQPLVLIGHSMGGDLAIRLAVMQSARVIGSVIVDYNPDIDSEISTHVRTDFNSESCIYQSTKEYIAEIIRKRPLASPLMLERIAREALKSIGDNRMILRRDPAMGYQDAADADGVLDRKAQWNIFKRSEWPKLLVRGVGSAVLPQRVAHQMSANLRNGQLQVVQCAGHAVMSDNPGGFANAVMPFVRTLLGSHP